MEKEHKLWAMRILSEYCSECTIRFKDRERCSKCPIAHTSRILQKEIYSDDE